MKLQTSGVLGTSYAIAKLAPKSANKWQALQSKVNKHRIIPVICKIIYQRFLVIRVKSSIFIKTFNN
jgi:hypothetical protein